MSFLVITKKVHSLVYPGLGKRGLIQGGADMSTVT